MSIKIEADFYYGFNMTIEYQAPNRKYITKEFTGISMADILNQVAEFVLENNIYKIVDYILISEDVINYNDNLFIREEGECITPQEHPEYEIFKELTAYGHCNTSNELLMAILKGLSEYKYAFEKQDADRALKEKNKIDAMEEIQYQNYKILRAKWESRYLKEQGANDGR